MKNKVIKKNLLSRTASYILLLPFLPAARPLLVRNNEVELILFILGFLILITLIIFSNNQPYIRISEKNLFVYLLYRHKPEIHNYSSINKATLMRPGKMVIESTGFDPLEIRLGKKEMKKLVERLEEENVEINKVYRN